MVNTRGGVEATEVVHAQTGNPKRGPRPLRANHGMSRMVDGSPLPTPFLVLIGVVTLVGLLLRLPSFNNSLSGDEISTFYIVNGHSLARVLSLVYSRQESTPPLYFILAWATKGWLGSGNTARVDSTCFARHRYGRDPTHVPARLVDSRPSRPPSLARFAWRVHPS